MPRDAHTKAAADHETAAKSHRTAAEHHGKGEHDKGMEHSTKAQDHSKSAHASSQAAHSKSQQSGGRSQQSRQSRLNLARGPGEPRQARSSVQPRILSGKQPAQSFQVPSFRLPLFYSTCVAPFEPACPLWR